MDIQTETYKKLKYLHKHFLKLPHKDFPCVGATSAWKLLSSIVELILDRYSTYKPRQLQLINSTIPLFESFCGYLDDSELNKVPWSIIPSLEELFNNLKPGTEFVICPLWETNYKIFNRNIVEYVDATFIKIKGFLFDADSDFEANRKKFLEAFPKSIYFVFYPRTERLSVLNFTLLGHEIGHIFATDWLSTNFEDTLNKYDTKRNIKSFLNGILPPDYFGPLFRPQAIEENADHIIDIYKRIMAEVLADIVCVYIFGHAALLSNYIFAIKYQLDDFRGVPKGYLSWRFRLYYIVKAFDLMMLDDEIKKPKVKTLFDQIRVETSSIDITSYNYKRTNHEYIKYLIDIIEKEFNSICYEAERFVSGQQYFKIYSQSHQDHVLEKLKYRIVPNCVCNDSLKDNPIELRNIVGGTWNYICEFENNDYRENFDMGHMANLLSLKAIELSYHQKHFENKYDSRKK